MHNNNFVTGLFFIIILIGLFFMGATPPGGVQRITDLSECPQNMVCVDANGNIAFTNGNGTRIANTTDGNTYVIQVYDSNGSTWRDALTFENGASNDTDPTNHPRVHLGSNVALTGLAAMAVSDVWGAEQTGANTIVQSEMNQWYLVTAACTMTMEDVASTITEGSKIGFRIRDAAETLTIDVDGTEKLVIDGTALAAGTAIECSGIGTEIILRAYDDVDGSGNEGYFVSYNGTCASE
jgi:hypothetical protein